MTLGSGSQIGADLDRPERGQAPVAGASDALGVPTSAGAGAGRSSGGTSAGGRVGAAYCAQCHKKEAKAWSQSVHAQLLTESDDTSVLELTELISESLGIEDVEVDPACSGCHFSHHPDAGIDDTIVSTDCESCHGLAAGWADLHSEWSVDDEPAQREQRHVDSLVKGMLSARKIVQIAQRCFECHKSPGEDLVDVGQHIPGSDFELVSWLGGEVRHNFHRTNQGSNADTIMNRKLQLYVIGQMLDVEYALRGVAKSTKDGNHFAAMKKRVAEALGRLRAIQGQRQLPEVAAAITAALNVPLELGGRAVALAAAKSIHESAIDFAEKHDGSGLGDLATLLPSTVVGTPLERSYHLISK